MYGNVCMAISVWLCMYVNQGKTCSACGQPYEGFVFTPAKFPQAPHKVTKVTKWNRPVCYL